MKHIGSSIFVTLLTILFIGLKLAGIGVVASWSWVWVLSPLWLGFAAVGFLCLLVIVFIMLKSLCGK